MDAWHQYIKVPNLQDNCINLILQKNCGGLITPASDVITIRQMTELLYR